MPASPSPSITIGLAIALVAFLMLTFFVKDKTSQSQYNTLRFLTSLCGGVTGYFISGTALFSMNSPIGQTGSVAVSGTAGAAFFFVIWFFYPKGETPKPPDAFYFNVPENTTFDAMVQTIVKTTHNLVNFQNFSPEQLRLILQSQEVHAKSPLDGIQKLKYLNGQLPNYIVDLKNNIFTITAK